MSTSMPWLLILAWSGFVGFVMAQHKHASRSLDGSEGFQFALNISVILGNIVSIGLLVYYFMHVAWYWPLILAFVGGMMSGLLVMPLLIMAGYKTVSLLAFVAWPACALWALLIIRGLAPN